MRKRYVAGLSACLGLIVAALPPLARAAPAPAAPAAAAPGGTAAAVVPFVDEATVGVVRVDVGAINLDAVEPWALDQMKAAGVPADAINEARAALHAAMPKAKQWQADFKTAGGQAVYVVVQFAQKQPSVFAVLPLGAGADAKALTALMKAPPVADAGPKRVTTTVGGPPGQPVEVHETNLMDAAQGEVIGGALVVADAETLKAVKQVTPVARRDLAPALAAAGGGAVRVAFVPPEGLRGLVTFQMPQLPPELGGGPSTVLTQGLRWASLGIDAPPAAGIRLTIQAKDADAAKKLRALADQLVAVAKKEERAWPAAIRSWPP